VAVANGCRDYWKINEDEAAWLSGCLLVPREATLAVALTGTAIGVTALEFGVSTQMMTYRMDVTGTRKQAQARACRRAPEPYVIPRRSRWKTQDTEDTRSSSLSQALRTPRKKPTRLNLAGGLSGLGTEGDSCEVA
jgi:Zn-dependent peptidase ImmA (M78 family)